MEPNGNATNLLGSVHHRVWRYFWHHWNIHIVRRLSRGVPSAHAANTRSKRGLDTNRESTRASYIRFSAANATRIASNNAYHAAYIATNQSTTQNMWPQFFEIARASAMLLLL